MKNFNKEKICEITKAKDVLNTISSIFSSEFEKKYSHYTDEELLNWMIKTLHGICEEEIEYGRDLLYTRVEMPSFAEFRKLCMSKGVWMSSQAAWRVILKYENKSIDKIPLVVKEAIDEIKLVHGVTVELNNSWIKNDFIDIYEKLVEEKRASYPPQVEYWNRPRNVKQNSLSKEKIPMPPYLYDEVARVLKKCKKLEPSE